MTAPPGARTPPARVVDLAASACESHSIMLNSGARSFQMGSPTREALARSETLHGYGCSQRDRARSAARESARRFNEGPPLDGYRMTHDLLFPGWP